MSVEPVGFWATRDELRRLLGEPDDTGGTSRKQKVPTVWKYGEIEYHFGPDGRVWLIYTEDADGTPRVLAGPARGSGGA